MLQAVWWLCSLQLIESILQEYTLNCSSGTIMALSKTHTHTPEDNFISPPLAHWHLGATQWRVGVSGGSVGGLGHRGSVEMLSCFPLHCSCNGKGRQATKRCQMEKAVKVRMHVCGWGNENILCTTWTSSSTALILRDDKTKSGWRTDESQNDECEPVCDGRTYWPRPCCLQLIREPQTFNALPVIQENLLPTAPIFSMHPVLFI